MGTVRTELSASNYNLLFSRSMTEWQIEEAHMDRETEQKIDDWLLRIVTPLAYILGVGGPIVMITLGIMGKLPS